jgi:phosphatidylserine/phosphatidylglycerophosphate/cardiolipin synthase-like enzyme
MKSAVIDDQYVIHGSMNWTAAGATKNDENTLIIKNSDLALKQKSFFNSLWNSIEDQWLIDDPMPESIQSYNSCFDEIDNDFDNIIDMDETDCLN